MRHRGEWQRAEQKGMGWRGQQVAGAAMREIRS